MDKTITSGLRTTFLVHAIVAVVLGVPLFLVPGRTLLLVRWIPAVFPVLDTGVTVPGTVFVDAILMRVLGGAMLALAFSSYYGWRAGSWAEVAILVQLETVFNVLALIAFLVPVLVLNYRNPGFLGPFWILSILLAVGFGITFGMAWMRNR